MKLSWSSPSQALEVIPQACLYPALVDPERGALLAEYWTGLAGTNLLTLTTNPNYPNRPTGREFLTSFESLQPNWTNSYGARVTGFLIPPTNGAYSFAVAADDTAQLFLSTNSASSNKVFMASVPAATAFREFTKFSSQTSAPVALAAGQKCYVELLQKQDVSSDHFSVAWKPPGTSEFHGDHRPLPGARRTGSHRPGAGQFSGYAGDGSSAALRHAPEVRVAASAHWRPIPSRNSTPGGTRSAIRPPAS